MVGVSADFDSLATHTDVLIFSTPHSDADTRRVWKFTHADAPNITFADCRPEYSPFPSDLLRVCNAQRTQRDWEVGDSALGPSQSMLRMDIVFCLVDVPIAQQISPLFILDVCVAETMIDRSQPLTDDVAILKGEFPINRGTSQGSPPTYPAGADSGPPTANFNPWFKGQVQVKIHRTTLHPLRR